MRAIEKKGTKKYKRVSYKLPIATVDKIAELDAKLSEAGYQVDWSATVVEALQKTIAAVEADLKEIGTPK